MHRAETFLNLCEYLGGTRFESQSDYRLSWMTFSQFSSVQPGEFRDNIFEQATTTLFQIFSPLTVHDRLIFSFDTVLMYFSETLALNISLFTSFYCFYFLLFLALSSSVLLSFFLYLCFLLCSISFPSLVLQRTKQIYTGKYTNRGLSGMLFSCSLYFAVQSQSSRYSDWLVC